MRAWRGERDYLGVDALALEHALAIDDVPVTGNGDVVITGVVQAGIAFRVYRDVDDAVAAAQRVEILRRIEVIVDVYQRCQLARR